MKIIASLTMPKQVGTRPYSIILAEEFNQARGPSHPLFKCRFSTHIKYLDKDNAYESGDYDLTLEEALVSFYLRTKDELKRHPSCYELDRAPIAQPA